MADIIKVNTGDLNHWAADMSSVADALSRARSVLASVDTSEEWWTDVHINGTLRMKDLNGNVCGGDARQLLASLSQMLNRYDDHVRKLSDRIRSAGVLFEEAESAVGTTIGAIGTGGNAPGSSSASGGQQPYNNALISALGYPSNPEAWTPDMHKKYNEYMDNAVVSTDASGKQTFVSKDLVLTIAPDGALIQAVKTDSSFTKLETKTQSYEKDGWANYSETEETAKVGNYERKKSSPRSYMQDKDGKEIKKSYTNKEGGATTSRNTTIAQVGKEWKQKQALYHNEFYNGNDETFGKGSVNVGYAEGHAGVHAGLYRTTVSADGKETRHFEPGVSADIGGSVGLLDASASGRYGNEYAGVSGEVGVNVAYAEAKGGLELGMVDGKLAAHADGSAEAIAAEIRGSGAVDLLGVEGKVTGEVSVGIGVRGEVGYYDGKLVAEAGVVVGVGGSVRVELDIGKAVDNLAEGAQNMIEGAQDMIESAQGQCEAFGDWLKDLDLF